MISSGAIKNLAVAQKTTELNIAREYAQHLFLSGFYQQRGAQRVMFKGGTALRIAYRSPRFSGDLDFSGFEVTAKEIENGVVNTLEGMEQSGLSVSIEESKKTSGGYLSILELRFLDYRVRVLLEVSLRRKDGVKGRGVLIASDFVPAYTATLLPEDALVEEKIKALLVRKKPRDFFDCYFLLRKNMVPRQKKHLLVKVRQALLESKVNFKAELKDFLPQNQQPILNNFKQMLISELDRNI